VIPKGRERTVILEYEREIKLMLLIKDHFEFSLLKWR
jgi:hypothetical protein